MPRDYRAYLDDIMDAIGSIREYTAGLDYETFSRDRKTQDAVVRNLEVIGEAAGRIPESVLAAAPEIEWRKLHRHAQHPHSRVFRDQSSDYLGRCEDQTGSIGDIVSDTP